MDFIEERLDGEIDYGKLARLVGLFRIPLFQKVSLFSLPIREGPEIYPR